MKISSGRLIESLPSYLRPLILSLLETGEDIFLVGGIPRDILLNKNPKDADFAVKCNIVFLERLIETTYKIIKKVKTPFLTLNYTLSDGNAINVAHFRTEKYKRPAQLPIVKPVYSIKEDAKRRDFTINSIYIDINNKRFIDPLSGMEDLKNRILKVTYKRSFRDDPTRIFRAIRYKARMNLKYSENTLYEIKRGKEYIKLLSKTRIMNELKKISEEKERVKMIEELAFFSILNIELENSTLKKLKKLDAVLPYSKSSWIFFFYPVLRKRILSFPLMRKEKQALSIFLNHKVHHTTIKNLLKHYPFIEEILNYFDMP